MSFLSALGHAFQNIGHGAVKVTQTVAPYAPLISALPGIGGPFGMIFNTIVHVESLVGEVAKKGSDKKLAVMQLVMLAYPGIDTIALGGIIDGIVKVLNDAQKSLPALTPPTIDVQPLAHQ